MIIALCQINPTVGAIANNKKKHLDWYNKAVASGADLIVFPELSLIGYPPQDLLYRNQFLIEAEKALNDIVSHINIPTIIGSVYKKESNLFNSCYLIEKQIIKSIYKKILLPTYDIFDEDRYFTSGSDSIVESIRVGKDLIPIGFQICEDLWDDDYGKDLTGRLKKNGAELIINISASPYKVKKLKERYDLIKKKINKYNIPYLYCNLVGAQDEIIFDGQSLAFNQDGELLASGKPFEEEMILVDTANKNYFKLNDYKREEELFNALVLGVKDYFKKSNHEEAVIGISGGIDSAITSVIAESALGPSNVHGVYMPSKFSSSISKIDSKKLADNLDIDFRVMPINDLVLSFEKTLDNSFEGLEPGIAEENIQSRIRGVILMALSNKFGWLVLSTGNKTEMALGYCTLYGDMSGGLSVISDLSKSDVYSIANWINIDRGREVIPLNTLTRLPTAELAYDQYDPFDYEIVSPLVSMLIEESKSPKELVKMGYSKKLVKDISNRIRVNEYKRRQSAPGLKVTSKAFGVGRRVPIINQFEEIKK